MLCSCVKIFQKYCVFEKFLQAGNLDLHPHPGPVAWKVWLPKIYNFPMGVPYTHPARKVTLQPELRRKRTVQRAVKSGQAFTTD